MVAIEEDPMNLTEQLVAFISFKLFPLHRCDPFVSELH